MTKYFNIELRNCVKVFKYLEIHKNIQSGKQSGENVN